MSEGATQSPSRLREGLGVGQSGPPRLPAPAPDPARKREGRP
jgi:hypothetical protein